MNRLTRENWNQILDEFKRSVMVGDSKELDAKKAYLRKVKAGVEEIIEIGRAPGAQVFEYIDLNKLADKLKEISMKAQRSNKIRAIDWMRSILLIIEAKTGVDMLSKATFPPADVDVDDPASRQEYIHERIVNLKLDESQQHDIFSIIAEELWCSKRTIESDMASIKIFSDISTNIHIEMDINITQCADLIRGLFEQRSELMTKPSSDDMIQQIWHQLRPAIRKKIQSFLKHWGNRSCSITWRI